MLHRTRAPFQAAHPKQRFTKGSRRAGLTPARPAAPMRGADWAGKDGKQCHDGSQNLPSRHARLLLIAPAAGGRRRRPPTSPPISSRFAANTACPPWWRRSEVRRDRRRAARRGAGARPQREGDDIDDRFHLGSDTKAYDGDARRHDGRGGQARLDDDDRRSARRRDTPASTPRSPRSRSSNCFRIPSGIPSDTREMLDASITMPTPLQHNIVQTRGSTPSRSSKCASARDHAGGGIPLFQFRLHDRRHDGGTRGGISWEELIVERIFTPLGLAVRRHRAAGDDWQDRRCHRPRRRRRQGHAHAVGAGRRCAAFAWARRRGPHVHSRLCGLGGLERRRRRGAALNSSSRKRWPASTPRKSAPGSIVNPRPGTPSEGEYCHGLGSREVRLDRKRRC